jgi:hypothetical protein
MLAATSNTYRSASFILSVNTSGMVPESALPKAKLHCYHVDNSSIAPKRLSMCRVRIDRQCASHQTTYKRSSESILPNDAGIVPSRKFCAKLLNIALESMRCKTMLRDAINVTENRRSNIQVHQLRKFANVFRNRSSEMRASQPSVVVHVHASLVLPCN